MADNLLVLHPAQPDHAPDPDAVRQTLIEIGFIGEEFEFRGRRHHKPGEEFLYLLTFLGCSPVVALGEPGKTGDEFAHIQLEGPFSEPQFLCADNIKVPRCRCGYRLEQWQTMIDTWQNDKVGYRWTCPACDTSQRPEKLKWKQCAAFGRFFIKVWGVFEGEAVPSEALLARLEQCTGHAWQYSYLRFA